METGQSWNHGEYKFYGHSLAGIRTAMTMPELKISFDVSQGYPFLMSMQNFFITHGHLDHAAGIPYIISQKMMNSQNAPKFYMPKSLVEHMTEIMRLWSSIELAHHRFQFIPISGSEEIVLNNKYYIKPFPTTHRIESYGYTLFETRKKLKPSLAKATQDEIRDARQQGVDVTEIIHTPIVSFTGDTQIEFLDSRSWIKKSKILFVEATYLDNKKTISQAREWGHIHIDELIPRLPEIESEKVVIIHCSGRYSDKQALDYIQQKVPKHLHEKIVLFPGR